MSTNTASLTQSTNWLRTAIRANSTFCATSGAVLLLAAAPVSALLGVSETALFASLTGATFFRVLGVALLIYAADLWYLTRHETVSTGVALVIIALDVAWVGLSAWLILADVWAMTTAGNIAVAVVADIVFLFAVAQSWALYKQLNRTS